MNSPELLHSIVFSMLPEGLESRFIIESFKKTPDEFDIILVEKNTVPDLPSEYRNKHIINNVLNPITLNDFSIRGRRCKLTIKRRYWKFDGIQEMYVYPLQIKAEGTNLTKEFGDFLKEINRN